MVRPHGGSGSGEKGLVIILEDHTGFTNDRLKVGCYGTEEPRRTSEVSA